VREYRTPGSARGPSGNRRSDLNGKKHNDPLPLPTLVIIAAGLIGQNDYPSATKYWRRAPERPFSADPIETLIKPTVILSLPSIRSLLSVDRFCGLPCFQIVN
jgi:hypothetical protein